MQWLHFHQVHYLEGQLSLIKYHAAVFSYAAYQKVFYLPRLNETAHWAEFFLLPKLLFFEKGEYSCIQMQLRAATV